MEEVQVYNIETNNNFGVLEKYSNEPPQNEQSKVIRNKKVMLPKIDHTNYKEVLYSFLNNYRESPDDDPKYPQAAKLLVKNGHNWFHLSLLDMGKFNPNLKGFMAAEQKNIMEGIKDLVADFVEKFGEVKHLTVNVNKKNYGQ